RLSSDLWICLLIFYFSLLKYTYHYTYRSHISLQVAKLAKSAGVQILIFPTVCIIQCPPELLPPFSKNEQNKMRNFLFIVYPHDLSLKIIPSSSLCVGAMYT